MTQYRVMRPAPVAPDVFKRTLARMAGGVTVVSAAHAGRRYGFTASSFTSVSLHPPLVLVCAARRLEVLAAIEAAGAFGVSVLGAHQQALGMRFAGLLGDLDDRFAGVESATAVTSSPLLPGSVACLDCRLWRLYDGGDHTIVVGEVVHAQTSDAADPLLYGDRRWQGLRPLETSGLPADLETGIEQLAGAAERGRDLDQLLRDLDPVLLDGEFVYVAGPGPLPAGVRPVASFIETEGESAVLRRADAERAGLAYRDVFRMVTLSVASDLMAVGLIAAVSHRLAEAGVACNVVSALHHDHLLVPAADAERALAQLRQLQADAR